MGIEVFIFKKSPIGIISYPFFFKDAADSNSNGAVEPWEVDSSLYNLHNQFELWESNMKKITYVQYMLTWPDETLIFLDNQEKIV